MTASTDVLVDQVMADLQARVRARLRERLLRHGASDGFQDPAVFDQVESLLRGAAETASPRALLLPELLGDPETWRMETRMRYGSHRAAAGPLLVFVKRRVMMPVLRWLFEYSRDNFERQRHMNDVFAACLQELAIETVRLRQEVHRLAR